jgi:heme/copper-type cytochrome/quinol oxidase subunit 3
LAGGVIALVYAAATTLLDRPIESRRIVIDVAAWYWHFMSFLWIYIFAILLIAR